MNHIQTLLMSKIMPHILFIYFCALCTANAQVEDYFEHLTSNQGLSQNDVLCIYQDKFGFMWIGTNDGLNKYDGYSFEIYKTRKNDPNSIVGNLFMDITEDQQGNMWIATLGYGLNFYERKTHQFTNFQHSKDHKNSLLDNGIKNIFCDSQNRMWLVTRSGVDVFEIPENANEEIQFTHLFQKAEVGEVFSTISQDSEGRMLLGGPKGLYEILETDNSFTLKKIGGELGNVQGILTTKSQELFVATGIGLFYQPKSKRKNQEFIKIADGTFKKIKEDQHANIWAASNEGLFYFGFKENSQWKQLKHYSQNLENPHALSTNIIESLFIDHSGIIWIGTYGSGIHKLDPNRKQFLHYKHTELEGSISQNIVRLIYEDSNGTLWIGTKGGGLDWIPKEDFDGSYTNFRNISSIKEPVSMKEVIVRGRKQLIVGASNGIGPYVIDITETPASNYTLKDFENLKVSVFSVHQDHLGQIWLGTYLGGLHKFLPEKDNEAFHYIKDGPENLSSNIIRNIFQDKHRNLWVGTGDGLCMLPQEQLDKNSPSFIVYKHSPDNPQSISHNYILSILESSKGELWIGTLGGGLNKFIPSDEHGNGHFISFTEEDGLPNNTIKAILEDDDGFLWISTNRGISKFDPVKKIFKNYDVSDGLQSNEFQELAGLKQKDKRMLFGGTNGLNAFCPNEIKDNKTPPRVVINRLSIRGEAIQPGQKFNKRILLKQSLALTKKIQLNYFENNISFEFAALHYAAPSKNTYAYRLKGFDDQWQNTSSSKRFANFTNLSPGDYVFEVKATNNDGVWSQQSAQIHITIFPPFWKTHLAYVIYVILALAFLYAFRRYSVIRTKRKHQLEIEHLEKDKAEELQKMKLQFFTNISHEFRTPLTLISGPTEYLSENDEVLNAHQRQKQYQLILKNTKTLLRLVTQLLEFRKIERGGNELEVVLDDIVKYTESRSQAFQFMAESKNIHYSFESSLAHCKTWFSADVLDKIIANLLSNAFKFTPEGGSVRVKLQESSLKQKNTSIPCLEIVVEDTGPGIPSHKVKQVFERFFHEGNGQNQNTSGAGIGLALTKSLVELHHGQIYVDDAYQQGARFVFLIPIDKKTYRFDKKAHTPQVEPSNAFVPEMSEIEEINDIDESSADLLNQTILQPSIMIVEDNADMRAYLKEGLSQEFQIIEAIHGKDALEKMKIQMPSLIVCDIMMPEMDGITFSKHIKASKAYNHIPIVFLTAKSSSENELEGLKSGANDYITKPFSLTSLQLKLSNILKNRALFRKHFKKELTLEPEEVEVPSLDEAFLKEAMQLIEENMIDTEFNVEMMAKEIGISRSNLYTKFKDLTGLSPGSFIRNVRLKRAAQLLSSGELSIKEVMYSTGFNTASYFSKCFKKQYKVLPSDYRASMQMEKKQNNIQQE